MAAPTSRELPAVVLSTIFVFVCGDEPVYIPFRPTDQRYILSLVCTRWSDIVRSTSALWTNLSFTTPRSLHPSHNEILHQFVLCMTRSRNDMLTIGVDMGYTDRPFTIDINSIILPRIHRVRTLTYPMFFHPNVIDALLAPGGQHIALESMEVLAANPWAQPQSTFIRYRFLPTRRRETQFVISLQVTFYVHATVYLPLSSV